MAAWHGAQAWLPTKSAPKAQCAATHASTSRVSITKVHHNAGGRGGLMVYIQ